MKKENAITLIALIITIIVMLILASVVINLTLGENGLFTTAKYAVKQQKMAEVKERILLAIGDIQTENILKDEDFSMDIVVRELPNKIKDLTIEKDGDTAKGTCDGYNYKIDKDYNVIIEGLNENTGGNSQEGEEQKVLVTEITLNKTSEEIEVGNTLTIQATVEPSNASNKTLTWTSSDETILTVNNEGLVTGIKAGTATITLTAQDGSGISESLNITVKESGPVALVSAVNVGDYVAYDPTVGVASVNQSKLSYMSPKGTGTSHGNGSEERTFTALPNDGTDNGLKWQVLSKDTSTGEVVLISEKYPNIYRLWGPVGFMYAEQELNSICAIYGYGKGADTSKTFEYKTGYEVDGETTGRLTGTGARSINMTDLTNLVGGKLNADEYPGIYGTRPRIFSYYPSTKTSTGYSSSAKAITVSNTIYSVTLNSYMSEDSALYKLLGSKSLIRK